MLDFITETAKFAEQKEIEIVIKQHPHATEDHEIISRHIKKLKKQYDAIHIVDASIYHLMQHARFTACVNSGSVVDNLITQTPVLCSGKSFFYKSGAIIFNTNIQKGLNKVFTQNYNWQDMKDKQLKICYTWKNKIAFIQKK